MRPFSDDLRLRIHKARQAGDSAAGGIGALRRLDRLRPPPGAALPPNCLAGVPPAGELPAVLNGRSEADASWRLILDAPVDGPDGPFGRFCAGESTWPSE